MSSMNHQFGAETSQPPYPIHPSVAKRVHPEYAAFYEKYVKYQPLVHLQPIEKSRASGQLIPGAGPFLDVASTTDFVLSGRKASTGPELRLRAFTPHGEKPPSGWPVCFWFHGGGWVLGNIDTENGIATHLCARGRSVVIAVDYRLAPEDPFPAAVEDCWEAFLWAASEGKSALCLDTSKVAVAGSSAGGNLAAVVAQKATSLLDSPRILLQLLSVPVTDNTADPANNPSWKRNEFTPALSGAKMMWYRNHYLPDRALWSHPEASPLLWQGDWSKLPPAVAIMGAIDILCHEGEEFVRKLGDVGVPADMIVLGGMPHPFIAMDGVLQAGRDAIDIFCRRLFATMYPDATQ